ncbi:MAG: hypothetical protein OEY14_17360 [Myxococcales bacterium]|nr:hypothetical protein [Myxococcales bacterium]
MRSSVLIPSWFVLGLLLAGPGCAPTLEEGAYGCSSGECPEGWTCRYDGLCYASGSDAHELCSADSQCASGICNLGPDAMATVGSCGDRCTRDEDCLASAAGSRSVCAFGECLRSCTSLDPCTEPLSCHLDEIAGPSLPASVCFELADTSLDGSVGCDPMDGACAAPARCLAPPELGTTRGICALACRDSSECLGDGQCFEIRLGRTACLSPCELDAECEGQLVCVRIEAFEGKYCATEAWATAGFPFPPPTMRPMP